LIVNSEDLCKKRRHLATVRLRGHNGKTRNFRPLVRNSCGKARKSSSRGRHR
jgi:hypothetical protein